MTDLARSTRVHRGASELPPLAAAWESIGSTLTGPLDGPAWAEACAHAFTRDGDLRVVALGDLDSLRAVAPMVRRGPIGRRLEPLGVRELGEPTDFRYADQEAAFELARALAEQRAPVFISRTWRDSPIVEALRSAYRGRGLTFVKERPGCPFIDLDESWLEPERRISSRRRSDLRRARRRGEEHGAVEASIVSPGPAEAASMLDEAFRIEASGWKGSAGTALAAQPRHREFYRRFSEAAAEAGALRVAFLRIGGHAVAMQLAVEANERMWVLKVGYHPDAARCSPGMLLTAESIRDAAARGLRSFELLGVEAPWTRVWTTATRQCVAVRAYPRRPGGAVALAVDGLRVAAHRLADARSAWRARERGPTAG